MDEQEVHDVLAGLQHGWAEAATSLSSHAGVRKQLDWAEEGIPEGIPPPHLTTVTTTASDGSTESGMVGGSRAGDSEDVSAQERSRLLFEAALQNRGKPQVTDGPSSAGDSSTDEENEEVSAEERSRQLFEAALQHRSRQAPAAVTVASDSSSEDGETGRAEANLDRSRLLFEQALRQRTQQLPPDAALPLAPRSPTGDSQSAPAAVAATAGTQQLHYPRLWAC